jgi:hypothetical protein
VLVITKSESVGIAIVGLASGLLQYTLFQVSLPESIGRGVVLGAAYLVGAVLTRQRRESRRTRKHISGNDEVCLEGEIANEGVAIRAAEEAAARAEAERKAAEAAATAAREAAFNAEYYGASNQIWGEEEGGEWEEGVEEGEYEYTSHTQRENGKEGTHLEPAVLNQPLRNSSEVRPVT